MAAGDLNYTNKLSAAEVDARIAAVTLAGYDLGDLGASETIDLANGQVQYGVLTASTVITIPAPSSAQQELKLILTQDSTGGRLPTFIAADGTQIEYEGLGGQAPSLDLIKSGPYTNLVVSFDIGQGRIIAQVDNPYRNSIITTPSLILDPREVDSSLVLWLDAADRSTIVDGTGVASWTDKSGHGHSVAQATGSAQPTLSSLTNGFPAIAFTTAKYFSGVDHSDFDSASITIFVVLERPSDAGTSQLVLSKGLTSNSNLEWNVNVSSGDTANFGVSINGTNTTGGRGWNSVTNTVNTPYIYELRVDDPGDVAVSRVNGANESSGAFASARYTGTGSFVIGTSSMKISEILIYADILSSTKRDAINSYLTAKWGI